MSKYGEDVTVALTGISMDAEKGSLGPNTNLSLTGQQISIEQGFLSTQTIISLIEKSELDPSIKAISIGAALNLSVDGLTKVVDLIAKLKELLSDTPDNYNMVINVILFIQQ